MDDLMRQWISEVLFTCCHTNVAEKLDEDNLYLMTR